MHSEACLASRHASMQKTLLPAKQRQSDALLDVLVAVDRGRN